MKNVNRSQNHKEGAFFYYFKFFSNNANDSIKKLQSASEMNQQNPHDTFHLLKKMKTMLSSYEIIVTQMKDSCQFAKVPQFGECIVKIFNNLIGFIKLLISKMLTVSSFDCDSMKNKERISLQKDQPLLKNNRIAKKNFNKNLQRDEIKNSLSKQSEHSDTMTNQEIILQAHSSKSNVKQTTKHLFTKLNEDFQRLQTIHHENPSENSYKDINQKLSKLQQIETSKSQSLLNETVNLLNKKGQNIDKFVNQLQINLNSQAKDEFNEYYSKFQQSFSIQSDLRMKNAKEKLNVLFKEHILNYEKQKKQQMKHFDCQTNIEDKNEQKLKNSIVLIKKTQQFDRNKLKNETKVLQQELASFKNLFQQKTLQYGEELSKIRSQKISIENKYNQLMAKGILKKEKQSMKSQNSGGASQNNENIQIQSSKTTPLSKDDDLQWNNSMMKSSRLRSNRVVDRNLKNKVKFNLGKSQAHSDAVKNLALVSSTIQYKLTGKNTTTKSIKDISKQQNMKSMISSQGFLNFSSQSIESNKLNKFIMKKTSLKQNKFKQEQQIKKVSKQKNRNVSHLYKSNTISKDISKQSSILMKNSSKNDTNQNNEIQINVMPSSSIACLSSQHHVKNEQNHGFFNTNFKRNSTYPSNRPSLDDQTNNCYEQQYRDQVLEASRLDKINELSQSMYFDKINQRAQEHIESKDQFIPYQKKVSNRSQNYFKNTLNTQQREIQSKIRNIQSTISVSIPQNYKITYRNTPNLSFSGFDILNLFLSHQNCESYQYLSISLLNQHSKYTKNHQNIKVKNIKQISINNISQEIKPSMLNHNYSSNNWYNKKSDNFNNFNNNQEKIRKQDQNSIQAANNLLSQIIFKYLSFLRKNKKMQTYCLIRNFIQFPSSSVKKANEAEWKIHSKDNYELGYFDIKRYISRINKLHHECYQFTFNDNEIRTGEKLSIDQRFKVTEESADSQNIYKANKLKEENDKKWIDSRKDPNSKNIKKNICKMDDSNHRCSICNHWMLFLRKIGILFDDNQALQN